jgi:hypothetical protein
VCPGVHPAAPVNRTDAANSVAIPLLWPKIDFRISDRRLARYRLRFVEFSFALRVPRQSAAIPGNLLSSSRHRTHAELLETHAELLEVAPIDVTNLSPRPIGKRTSLGCASARPEVGRCQTSVLRTSLVAFMSVLSVIFDLRGNLALALVPVKLITASIAAIAALALLCFPGPEQPSFWKRWVVNTAIVCERIGHWSPCQPALTGRCRRAMGTSRRGWSLGRRKGSRDCGCALADRRHLSAGSPVAAP